MIVMEISHDIQCYDYNIINQNSHYDVLYKKIFYLYCYYYVIAKLFIYFNWHHANLKIIFNNYLLLSFYCLIIMSLFCFLKVKMLSL